jgi:transcriptional regulator with XRE-family HTH domain
MNDSSNSNVRSLFMPPRRHFVSEQIPEALGQRIARLRKERGLSQVELAEQLELAQPNVSDYERGVVRPNVEVIVALTRILKVSADELLGLESSPRQHPIKDRRLIQYLSQVERLPKRKKDALLMTIRAFLAEA